MPTLEVEEVSAADLLLPVEILVDHIAEIPLGEIAALERMSTSIDNETQRVVLHLYHSALRMIDAVVRGRRYRAHVMHQHNG